MSELISKEQAMAYPLSYDHYDKVHGSIKFINGVESYRDYIDGLPTVEERKHGRWIKTNWGEYQCSVCKNCEETTSEEFNEDLYFNEADFIEKNKFCRHCGTIMDEVSEDE